MFSTGAAGKPSSGLQDPQQIWQFLNEAVSLANGCLPALRLNNCLLAPRKIRQRLNPFTQIAEQLFLGFQVVGISVALQRMTVRTA